MSKCRSEKGLNEISRESYKETQATKGRITKSVHLNIFNANSAKNQHGRENLCNGDLELYHYRDLLLQDLESMEVQIQIFEKSSDPVVVG